MTMGIWRVVFLLGIAVTTLSGCVVYERPVAPRGCAGGFWVRGHYGPRGAWHPGHWRCPGVVEVVEVD
jgi:hypothetical protein